MSAQTAEVFDLERLLAPIPGENQAGTAVRREVFDKAKELRKTESSEGALGTLREGEVKGPSWRKVEQLCAEEIEKRSKDLQLAVWFAEARVRQRGLVALADGLQLVQGLHERYWDDYFPALNDEDALEMRSGRLDELDMLLSQCAMEARIVPVTSSASTAYAFWEWQQISKIEGSGAKPEEKQRAAAEANARRQTLMAAVDKTNRAFYESIYEAVMNASTVCENLRMLVEAKFKDAPGFKELDGAPNLGQLRGNLKELKRFTEDILKKKGGLPAKYRDAGGDQAPNGDEGSSNASDPSDPHPTGNLPLSPVNRADAILRLNAIAEFFQRTEPHSPISYLVQRSAKWGALPLEKLLEELIKDEGVLSNIRETLGLTKDEKPSE